MQDEIAERLPEPLRPLAAVAGNLWWSWQPDGPELFHDVDPERWRRRWGGNPITLLRDAPRGRLEAAARDGALVARVERLARRMSEELARPAVATGAASAAHPIAFFCAEYALHPSLPIYSGGLGVLAGDILKEASDAALPMVAVGLLYRRGYFRQRLDPSGWQHEFWTPANPEELPVHLERDGDRPRTVAVELRDREVRAQIWRVDVGRVPLYLLDTDLPENDPTSRWITATLYVGDRRFRLMQYAVLATGGVRALRSLGIDPALVHINEGHAALAALELAREQTRLGVRFEEAIERARQKLVFTTHTPVAAGNERYEPDELSQVLRLEEAELRLGHDGGAAGRLGTTEVALRTSRAANAVSRQHGKVARAMWRHLWGVEADQVPIGHVTNGVHLPTWMAPPVRQLLDEQLGPGWPRDPEAWSRIDAIPDERVWEVRNRMRGELVETVRERSILDRLQRGENIAYVEGAARVFDPGVVTLGFARRIAAYKRLHLIIQDPPRALALLRGPHPLQLLIAGKAHPRDDDAKRLVQMVFALKNEGLASMRVAFLEDYDMALAAELVAGCDVWVNLPRPPLEASGTSGMKAAMNGGLNLSVLDGWWCEGYEDGRSGGWAIASDDAGGERAQDVRDSDRLYDLLEREVLPEFYARDAQGLPRAWIARIKASLRMAIERFSASRMLREYAERVYR